MLSLFALLFLSAQPTQTGPSFSCAHVTSEVNKLICASPTLSALDRELANVFTNMKGQPIDQNKLQQDEKSWLSALLRDCKDTACIQSRYQSRIAELKEQSLKAASPAVYEETHPFPAPPAIWAQAQALIGQACSYQKDFVGPIIPGFRKVPRFLPVTLSGGSVVVRETSSVRFAFLVDSPCQIRDVITLPASAVGDRFLQCSVSDPALTGFGIRNPQTHGLDAFWSVDPATHKIERVAIGVLGIEKSVKCQQPETAE